MTSVVRPCLHPIKHATVGFCFSADLSVINEEVTEAVQNFDATFWVSFSLLL